MSTRGRDGALPRLPFFDGAFDLVLCAHLLFIYARRFDFAWHLAACQELVRVSAGEVRLHPVDLGYGLRLTSSGTPRLASPAMAQEILARLQRISAPYGTRIEIESGVGVIRVR